LLDALDVERRIEQRALLRGEEHRGAAVSIFALAERRIPHGSVSVLSSTAMAAVPPPRAPVQATSAR
jgi:hypothetical protein